MKKSITLVIVVAIIILGVVLWYGPKQAEGPSTAPDTSSIPPLVGEPPAAQNPPASTAQTIPVTYGANGYAPNELEIKSGDTVSFKNESGQEMWPASGPHPTHDKYPEFDSKRGIPAGEFWSFTFTRVGTWKFHNHRDPTKTGSITVK